MEENLFELAYQTLLQKFLFLMQATETLFNTRYQRNLNMLNGVLHESALYLTIVS